MEDICNQIQSVGKGIGNTARYRILEALMAGPKTVNQLVKIGTLSQSAVSQHLKTLKACHLVVDHKRGKEVFYSLNAEYLLSTLQKFTSQIPAMVVKDIKKIKRKKIR